MILGWPIGLIVKCALPGAVYLIRDWLKERN